jgi:hypothetical protein
MTKRPSVSIVIFVVRTAIASPEFPVELGGVGKLHAPFLTERRGPVLCCAAENPGSPVFLLNLVALANLMRLSLLKGAHAALSCAARQEIRVRSGVCRPCNGFK